MEPFKLGMLVKSIAGHDKGLYYIISDLSFPYVYIVDGKRRLLEKSKKKNPIHLLKTNIIFDLSTINTNKKLKSLLSKYNS